MTLLLRSLRTFFVATMLVGVWLVPAAAQDQPGPKPDRKLITPPKDLPRPQRGDRQENLEFLFGALKMAPDKESAKHIENRIWALWVVSKSDTTNLLMVRAKAAIEAENPDLAIKLLDAIIEINPDYVEAWNRRATVLYGKKEFSQALSDIRRVLAMEPRHFGALAGLGMILQEIGEDKRALDVYRRVLEIHPHVDRIPALVKGLTTKIEGRNI